MDKFDSIDSMLVIGNAPNKLKERISINKEKGSI